MRRVRDVGEREVESKDEDEDREMGRWRRCGPGEEDLESCENGVERMLGRLCFERVSLILLSHRTLLLG